MHRPTARALLGAPETPELVFRRTYRAPAADVLEACTSTERLARWFGAVSGDPRRAGDSFSAQLSDDVSDVAHGKVLACEPDAISVSWTWQGERESVITARVVDLDGELSELVLIHALAEPDHAAGYGGGWEQILQSLARSFGDHDRDAPSDEQLETEAATTWRTMTEHPLQLEQLVPAPIEQTWQAFATAEGLQRWWWSHWDDVRIQADVRPGGTYRFEAPAAGIMLEGTYLHVEKPQRLAFTWQWNDADGTSADEAVDIRLEPAGQRTRLRLHHSGPWADAAPAASYREGWEFTLGRLDQAVRGPQ